ncbi:molybdenum cofactor guanylyltransferase [Halarsenatibacter silvermanii]|uniref:molybdenum cofactor guanylyltransferase n=1 Tax=Halarsenatibacter silvermanii TaxID=321763 RepID=UPI0013562BF0|nr:molybdenum cofactor guanylyltransferase [Halarsenatibacter silvermanii]
MSIYILAGGNSTRMENGDKPHVLLTEDKTMLEFILSRFRREFKSHEIKIVAKDSKNFENYNADVIEDIDEAGPLGGIMTALEDTRSEKNFFLACDMPFFSPEAAHLMLDMCSSEGLVPENEDGYLEPLAAVYRRSCLPSVEKMVEAGEKKIITFYSRVEIEKFDKEFIYNKLDFKYLFYNINTREELKKARENILPRYFEVFGR